jgi:hypothetical protein
MESLCLETNKLGEITVFSYIQSINYTIMSFIADGYNRIAQNRALKTSNKEGFKSNNRDVSKGSGTVTRLKFKEVSKYELEKVKSRLKKKIQRDKNRLVINTLVLTIIILGVLYSYFN